MAVIPDICLSVVKMCQIGPAQPRVSDNTSQTSLNRSLSLSLFLCCISPRSSSICLPQPLSPPCCISDYKCSPAQGQLDALYIPYFPLCLTSVALSISTLYFSCFAPSCLSVCHVFLALLFCSSLGLYWLPSALLPLYYISLSPSPSVPSTLQ